MSQPFTMDIFSADFDDKDFVTSASQSNLNMKKTPINESKKYRWRNYCKPQVVTKSKKKAKVAQKIPAQAKKADWKPIPSVTDSSTTKCKPKEKIDMGKPNLKVVVGKAASVQINIDKSKNINVEQTQAVSKPAEKEEPKPEVSEAQLPQNQSKSQPPVIQGRMTASAFMNINQSLSAKPKPQPPVPSHGPNHNFHSLYSSLTSNYPKGIPKSFLTQQHQQQIEGPPRSSNVVQLQNPQTVPPTSSQGPAWEAIPSKSTSVPVWTSIKTRFDQLPTGSYIDQKYPQSQSYEQERQGFVPSVQPFGQEQSLPGSNAYGRLMSVRTDLYYEESMQQYSPSDAYTEMTIPELHDDILDRSPDSQQSGSKRLSAFQRLGPVTQPKKPKLTINLMLNKKEAVREVVDESKNLPDEKYTPVLERADIQTSLDDIVMRYISFWPWKKPLSVRRCITARESKAVMQLQLEQVEELYEIDKSFFQILVTGYPESWNKEDVLDAILEAVKGKSFIPCFIEFTKTECKFLVIRSRPALLAIHKLAFSYRKDDVVLKISILLINLSVNQIDFIPRLILRKRLSTSMEGEKELNLKNFTLASDISHFLYFPLDRVTNQSELMQLQSSVPWQGLTKLVLSHNRMTTLSGFDLTNYTPKLKHLDLSNNRIGQLTALLSIRELPLTTIALEGNPLCLDYIHSELYIKALKMMFPALKEIDGVKITQPGEFPPYKRNYSPPDAEEVATKLLETLFPLLDSGPEERQLCENLYMDDAVMTITYMHKLRYRAIFKDYRTLFLRSRLLDEGKKDATEGAVDIAKLILRWPKLEHDPQTFTVDVVHHTHNTTILRVSGIMKVTTETLAEDEHLLHFTRTLVLHSLDSREYKIANEMIYWDLPDRDLARQAFQMTTIRSKNLSLKLDTPPDTELKMKLLEIFMNITELEQNPSERCLESKDWHLKNSLEYFAKLLELDNLEPLYD